VKSTAPGEAAGRPAGASGWDVALIGVFAALIAALSLAPAIPVGLGVPLTLQTLAVALAGLVLGPWRGLAAVGLYLVLGLVGLPVFAGGGAGPAELLKPAAGYLLSFPLAVIITGLIARWVVRRARRPAWLWLSVAALAGGLVATHPLGIVGLATNLHLPLSRAWLVDLVYWPGDLVKAVIAGGVAAPVHRAFPRLMARPVEVAPA